jgi:Mg/Co/Ni transporter MgtE
MSANNRAAMPTTDEPAHKALVPQVKSLAAPAAAALLAQHPAPVIAAVLGELHAAFAQDILAELPRGLVDGVMHAVPAETARQWSVNQKYADGTIGRCRYFRRKQRWQKRSPSCAHW